MRNTSLIIAALSVTLATVCLAGEEWHYTCTNSGCAFEGDLDIGGGFTFDEATGYCTTCKEFVRLQWDMDRGFFDDERTPPRKEFAANTNAPEKVGTVWNPMTGTEADLYPCPKCKELFMVISEISPESKSLVRMFCPRCGEKTLRLRSVALYD